MHAQRSDVAVVNEHNTIYNTNGDKSYEKNVPLPAFDITARESPTFATKRWLPTKIAVDAVDPTPPQIVVSAAKKSASVPL
jgi:hypothetical protein